MQYQLNDDQGITIRSVSKDMESLLCVYIWRYVHNFPCSTYLHTIHEMLRNIVKTFS